MGRIRYTWPVPVPEYEFMSNNENAILSGFDASLMAFAQNHLGYTRNKGVDFIAKFNNTYVIGEAKFISDEGGHQNDQFLDAMTTLEEPTAENVRNIAILDGVLLYRNHHQKCARYECTSIERLSI